MSELICRDEHHEAVDTDVGGRCCEVSGNDLEKRRHHHRSDQRLDSFYEESSMSSSSQNEHHRKSAPGFHGGDESVLTERDRKEFMSLANENISMDFILEMKEAFQLFDKVFVNCHSINIHTCLI